MQLLETLSLGSCTVGGCRSSSSLSRRGAELLSAVFWVHCRLCSWTNRDDSDGFRRRHSCISCLVLLLALVSIFEVRNLFVISAVIGVLSIPAYTRVARANSLAVSSREFVTAARAIGTKPHRILFREVIPNVLPTLLAYTMVAAAFVVVVEGSLSFLGLSVQLPTPTWGNMINQARRDIKINVAQVIWPSLALTLTVLSLNQVGDFFQQRREVRGSNL